MSFADNLRAVRKEKNISQEELAELLGVSRQAVSRWEQGAGYPEMEKMILLAQKMNVSLDYLAAGEGEAAGGKACGAFPTGRIMIRAQDGRAIVNCYKVLSSPIFKSKKNEPKYALFGVDGGSFWGENSTLLGWYAGEEEIQKEVEAILKALNRGEAAYELKYAAQVKKKGLWGIVLSEGGPA